LLKPLNPGLNSTSRNTKEDFMKIVRTALIAGALLLVPVAAGAQSPAPELNLSAPTPDQCTIHAISQDRLASPSSDASIAPSPAVPLETPNTEAATPTPFVAPVGTPVSGETASNVEAIVIEYYACQNANDQLRVLALFSDRYLEQIVSEGDIDPTALATIATPMPVRLESEQLMIAINGMIEIEAGVYGVNVVGVDGATGDDFTEYLLVIDTDGQLRIDQVLRLTQAED
jgi:hypothetical protein